jgi:hypothetical protein
MQDTQQILHSNGALAVVRANSDTGGGLQKFSAPAKCMQQQTPRRCPLYVSLAHPTAC